MTLMFIVAAAIFFGSQLVLNGLVLCLRMPLTTPLFLHIWDTLVYLIMFTWAVYLLAH